VNSELITGKAYTMPYAARLIITLQKYEGRKSWDVLNRGTRYTSVAPPTRFEKTRIKAMVVISSPCCPLPSGPIYWDKIIAISRLRTAASDRVPKVFKIFPNNG